jgi:hypothetical protein
LFLIFHESVWAVNNEKNVSPQLFLRKKAGAMGFCRLLGIRMTVSDLTVPM